jgi:uncharacterized protein (DUF342 family)
MVSENKTGESKHKDRANNRSNLIIKIALFLNYLTKANYEKLISDLKKHKDDPKVDILKIMLDKRYISQKDLLSLKKTCTNFAKVQDDMRFGSLCISFEFLTQSNLDLALEEQKRLEAADQHIRLGDLLIDAGMLSKRQLKLILQKQKLENRVSTSNNNKEQPNELPFEMSDVRAIREVEVLFFLQNDALKLFTLKTDDFDSSMILSDLKFLLEKNGIIYGIVDDDSLNSFIKNDKYHNEYFEIARGLEPIDDTDAKIVYMFELDYLKAGQLAEDGTIDFKDRGDIPFVEEGDVIAEKIPPKEGRDGVNVYGDTIPKADSEDISFNIGKGVHLSEDKLKVVADVKGNPKSKPGGELSVNDAYFIDGDVDYKTGHIKFDKNVYITGTIKSGFRVEAIDVIANTIDGGIVEAQGNVFIQNGVKEASIKANGNVKIGFMHRSNIACTGDVNIVKEIVDSEVFLEGKFEMDKGRMFSSSVCAKGGAVICNVGSERTKPSSIMVGTSVYFEKALKDIDVTIEKKQNLLDNKTLEKTKLSAQMDLVLEKLSNFDQSKRRTITMIEEMKKNTDEKLNTNIELFQKSLDEADKKIHALNDSRLLLEARLKQIKNTITTCAAAVTSSVKEKFTLKRLNQTKVLKPVLDVSGKIFAKTKVSGMHSSVIIKHTVSRSRIMEMNTTSENSKDAWEMVITSF